MIACYQEVNSDIIDKLKTKPSENLGEEVEKLQEDDLANILYIEKIWDNFVVSNPISCKASNVRFWFSRFPSFISLKI